MITKEIRWFGQQKVLACDAKCDKAWGIGNRPHRVLSGDEDDIEWLADGELGDAPEDPGTYEGDHAKPIDDSERLNKWCARACERSRIVDVGAPIDLPDWSKRIYNMPSSDPAKAAPHG